MELTQSFAINEPKVAKKDGGPAFPRTGQTSYHNDGMSLRDWFAGQALAGLAASPHTDAIPSVSELATGAYRLADAMIAERDKAA